METQGTNPLDNLFQEKVLHTFCFVLYGLSYATDAHEEVMYKNKTLHLIYVLNPHAYDPTWEICK